MLYTIVAWSIVSVNVVMAVSVTWYTPCVHTSGVSGHRVNASNVVPVA